MAGTAFGTAPLAARGDAVTMPTWNVVVYVEIEAEDRYAAGDAVAGLFPRLLEDPAVLNVEGAEVTHVRGAS